jgi:hypothetical protein
VQVIGYNLSLRWKAPRNSGDEKERATKIIEKDAYACNFFCTGCVSQKSIAMKLLFVVLFSLSSLVGMAQASKVLEDPQAQERSLNASFQAIQVGDGIELYLVSDATEKLVVSVTDGDAELLDRFKTVVENGVLKLYYNREGLKVNLNRNRKLKAYVAYKEMQNLDASAGSRIHWMKSASLKDLKLKITSGARLDGDLSVGTLDVEQNSGSMAELTGSAQHLSVDVSSGAMFKGFDFSTQTCEAKATSGAAIRVTIDKELSAKANSGGGIQYKGEGVIKDIKVNSGGSVKRA